MCKRKSSISISKNKNISAKNYQIFKILNASCIKTKFKWGQFYKEILQFSYLNDLKKLFDNFRLDRYIIEVDCENDN